LPELIIPCIARPIQQHAAVPWLWRAQCACGWTAWAGNRDNATAAINEHLSESDPFPDYLDAFTGMKGPHDNGRE
jgi:hypothetical protein